MTAVRGVAWCMGGPPRSGRPVSVYAVAGRRVLCKRSAGNSWRWGTYMNEEDAQLNATRMTESDEKSGLRLIAGPMEFSVASDDDNAIREAVMRLFDSVFVV